jgi:hypothetical protein
LLGIPIPVAPPAAIPLFLPRNRRRPQLDFIVLLFGQFGYVAAFGAALLFFCLIFRRLGASFILLRIINLQ